ncbi:MAG TPA: tyrosine--tRNA ligase [Thermodesulfobacteriota bacterium]|nr:tyrosine--tRNA ligase [Thermodesulfobacteriota bacterium]
MELLDPEVQLGVIKRGTAEIISEEELLEKLKKSAEKREPLRIKAGFDPTAPDLHLGHCVLLKKLRDFQDLGHTVIFLIGDFTAMIGDPSGRTETRPPLTREEVDRNAKTYERQVFKILRKDRTEVVFNSSWLSKMSAEELLVLASLQNVARMLEREDFHKRYTSGVAITLKEFLYPLVQAYDSVNIRSDVEFGGTDQKFNILLGRDVQRYFNQEPQIAILLPILEGLDGVQKMSKSLGNYIAVEDSPEDIYGKVMSLSDTLMWKYYELLSSQSQEEINEMKARWHPMEAKKALAFELVSWFHAGEEATRAQKDFEVKFSERQFPEDAREVTLKERDGTTILDLVILSSERVRSRGEAKRLIEQGGVSIDGERITDPKASVLPKDLLNLKIGKREFVRVRFSRGN